MSRPRVTFAASLLLSAGIHVALFVGLMKWYGVDEMIRARPEQVVRLLAPPTVPPQPDLGEAKSKGQSIDSSNQQDVQTAPKSVEDQAALTRDPHGQGPAAMSSPAAAPQMKPLTDSVFAQPPEALPSFPKSDAPAWHKIAPQSKAPPGNEDRPQPQQDQRSATAQPAPQQPPAPPQQQASNGGKPQEHSDRDSDLFAKQSALEYRDGQVVARSGRELKFARPEENLAADVDSATIEFPAHIKMHIQLDATGHVRYVAILHSSGSASIDRTFELATYASWFEPAKDRSGKPIPDEIDFDIVLE